MVAGTSTYSALADDKNRVYLYIESNEKEVLSETLVHGEFIKYPNGKDWERASKILHYSVPVSEEQWKRKVDKTPYFR